MLVNARTLEMLANSPLAKQLVAEQEAQLFAERGKVQAEIEKIRHSRALADEERTAAREKARVALDTAREAVEAAEREYNAASWAREHAVDQLGRDERELRTRLATLLPDRFPPLKQRMDTASRIAHERGNEKAHASLARLSATLAAALEGGPKAFDRDLPRIESELRALERDLAAPWNPPTAPLPWTTDQHLAALRGL